MKPQDVKGFVEHLKPSVIQLGLSPRSYVLQQNNDSEHTSKNTHDLKWPTMSLNKLYLTSKFQCLLLPIPLSVGI